MEKVRDAKELREINNGALGPIHITSDEVLAVLRHIMVDNSTETDQVHPSTSLGI